MLVLPKKDEEGKYYLSYSQINTWKKSKREYIRQYFFGEKFLGNDYTDFGGKIGEALEYNDFSNFTEKEQELLKTIPRYDQFEREIKLQMDGFYIKGYIDTNTSENTDKKELVKKIADYKTGDCDKKEAEYASDDYIQLDIYAAAIQQETGVLPEEVYVHLIDRKGNAFSGEKLVLGDKLITITKEVNDQRIKEVKDFVQEVAEEISEYYKLFLTLNTVT